MYGASLAGGIPNCPDGGGCGLIFSMRPPRAVCKTSFCDWTESPTYEFNPLSHFTIATLQTAAWFLTAQ